MKQKNTAYIYRSAITKNYHAIEKIVSEPYLNGMRDTVPEVISVVKADAYGHGIRATAGALGEAGCHFFAVSSEEEAAELREIESFNGRTPEILILSHIIPENAGDMIEQDITVSAVSAEDAKDLSAAVSQYHRKTGSTKPLKVHIKLDTGMNRVGYPADSRRREETVKDITELANDPNIKICGIFTHFSVADDEMMDGKIVPGTEDRGGYTQIQLERYRKTLDALKEAGVNVGMRHAANSAAILKLPEAYFDAVRAGVILYGLQPNGSVDDRFTPVMRFDSTVIHIHEADAGECVSYGAQFRTERKTVLATVAAGYADGFERAYTGCMVKINGREYRQVGRICMDQFMVDVTDCGDTPVKPGDAVTLFGGDDGTMTNSLARRAGTINYEVVCKVGKRVKRKIIL